MMFGWIVKGLRTGVLTTSYPRRGGPTSVGRTVPRINSEVLREADCRLLSDVCPTRALTCTSGTETQLVLDYASCISCERCALALPGVISMTEDFELAARDVQDLRTIYAFSRNAHGP